MAMTQEQIDTAISRLEGGEAPRAIRVDMGISKDDWVAWKRDNLAVFRAAHQTSIEAAPAETAEERITHLQTRKARIEAHMAKRVARIDAQIAELEAE